MLHAMQLAPPTPQDAKADPVQIPDWQQPDGHEVESQMQEPPAHRWPAPQAADDPQEHWPLEEQRSALVVLHAVHADPPGAQADKDLVVQVEPWQQPEGQEVESQTHVPPTQRLFRPQAGDAPHMHWPVVEQRFAFVASHAAQAAPPGAQADNDRPVQVAP